MKKALVFEYPFGLQKPKLVREAIEYLEARDVAVICTVASASQLTVVVPDDEDMAKIETCKCLGLDADLEPGERTARNKDSRSE